MNIIFMGTPDFAVSTLKALFDAGHTISAVFTQLDKPKGRGYKLAPPPVKEFALQNNIPVYQPKSLKNGEDAITSFEIMQKINPDVIVVVAYGKIMPKNIIDLPKKGCINVHASLLPKYRGSAPIQFSILNGETETGVTTMLMDEGIDTGDLLLKAKIAIGENDNISIIHDKLADLGAKLLLETLDKIDEIVPEKQDESIATYVSLITKDMSKIDFSRPAKEIHNKIRAICGTAEIEGRKLKIYASEVVSEAGENSNFGEICDKKNFEVLCGTGIIKFTQIQAEGGKRMSAQDYLRGKPL